ncbi:hypothetical protein ABZ656_14940 [Streptomyces sp. NPDC007095]
MLTGPLAMLAWSFVRDGQPLADTTRHPLPACTRRGRGGGATVQGT